MIAVSLVTPKLREDTLAKFFPKEVG